MKNVSYSVIPKLEIISSFHNPLRTRTEQELILNSLYVLGSFYFDSTGRLDPAALINKENSTQHESSVQKGKHDTLRCSEHTIQTARHRCVIYALSLRVNE